MKTETKLALATAVRSTMYDPDTMNGPDLKVHIVASVEDWFTHEPSSSDPFDKAVVLADLEAATNIEIAQVLSEMGFVMRPLDGGFRLDPDTWEAFVNKYAGDRQTA
jgi:hypothetical protein